MIRSNLKSLLAERNTTAVRAAKDTRISRTTLGALVNNNAQGIQFDTLNTLCMYLRATPDQLLAFVPYDISHTIDPLIGDIVHIYLAIREGTREWSVPLRAEGRPVADDYIDIKISYAFDYGDGLEDLKAAKRDEQRASELFNSLPIQFSKDVFTPITQQLLERYKHTGCTRAFLTWPFTAWTPPVE